MRAGHRVLAALTLLVLGACDQPVTPILAGAHGDLAGSWRTANPAEVSLDAAGLERAADSVGSIPALRSLMVARHGRLAFERYWGGTSESTLFDVRSVTKSVVSSLTAIALRQGALTGLDASIADYMPPDYTLSPEDSAVTLRNLVTMSSGYEWNDDNDYNTWVTSRDPIQTLLDRPHAYVPGAAFVYNSAAVHLLAVLVARATSSELSRYAAANLFVPLGVKSIGWEQIEPGVVNGGSGIALTGRELLKLGQLMLQDGWSGTRSVIPEAWVQEATRPHFSWRTNVGEERGVCYGYLWWTADGPPRAFFAWGFGGQLVYVAPSLDLVVVTTTDWHGMSFEVAHETATRLLGVIVGDILPAAGVAAPDVAAVDVAASTGGVASGG